MRMQMYLASQPIRTTTYPYPMRIRISGRSILEARISHVGQRRHKCRHAPLGACPAIQLVAAPGAHRIAGIRPLKCRHLMDVSRSAVKSESISSGLARTKLGTFQYQGTNLCDAAVDADFT
jgi:hypothetical protein